MGRRVSQKALAYALLSGSLLLPFGCNLNDQGELPSGTPGQAGSQSGPGGMSPVITGGTSSGGLSFGGTGPSGGFPSAGGSEDPGAGGASGEPVGGYAGEGGSQGGASGGEGGAVGGEGGAVGGEGGAVGGEGGALQAGASGSPTTQ